MPGGQGLLARFGNSRAPPPTPRHVSDNVCTQQEHRVLLPGNIGSKQEILAYFVDGEEGGAGRDHRPQPLQCRVDKHPAHIQTQNIDYSSIKSLWHEDRAQHPPARVPDIDYSSIRFSSTRMFSLTEAEVSLPHIPVTLI